MKNQKETGEHGSVNFPEYLDKNQNILNQHPFNSLFEVKTIFPEDYFLDTSKGRATIMKLLMKADIETYKINPNAVARTKDLIENKYRNFIDLRKIMLSSLEYLKQFPYCLIYLNQTWGYSYDYDVSGEPTGKSPSIKFRTYLKYLKDRNPSKYLGLKEILPKLSTFEEIKKYIPKKRSKSNHYRVINKSESLN